MERRIGRHRAREARSNSLTAAIRSLTIKCRLSTDRGPATQSQCASFPSRVIVRPGTIAVGCTRRPTCARAVHGPCRMPSTNAAAPEPSSDSPSSSLFLSFTGILARRAALRRPPGFVLPFAERRRKGCGRDVDLSAPEPCCFGRRTAADRARRRAVLARELRPLFRQLRDLCGALLRPAAEAGLRKRLLDLPRRRKPLALSDDRGSRGR